MATKYTRDSDSDEGIPRRQTPWMRQGPPQRQLSHRQRMFILFMGVVMIGLLGQLAYKLNSDAANFSRPVQRGEGEIVGRVPSGAHPDAGAITVSVALVNGEKREAPWFVPAPYWSQLAVGDRIAVLYRVVDKGATVELVECGVVALPEPVR